MSQEASVLGSNGAQRGGAADGGHGHADPRLPVPGRTLARWPHGVEPFFVQQHERGPWHVETVGDPERMLCGIVISVDDNVKIQKRWGLKPCLWCKKKLEELSSAA